jgi:hypothetical protein
MNRRQGTTFLPWLFILLMLGSLLWLLNRLNVQLQYKDGCEQQMLKIYEVLNLYEQQHGRLPALELFPEDAVGNEESLLNVLSRFEFNPEWAVCPASHPVLKKQKLTYLWNTALNHTSLRDRKEITWVLVDIQALDDRIPGPHFRAYHILYTDGRVEHSPTPPHSLPVQFE